MSKREKEPKEKPHVKPEPEVEPKVRAEVYLQTRGERAHFHGGFLFWAGLREETMARWDKLRAEYDQLPSRGLLP